MDNQKIANELVDMAEMIASTASLKSALEKKLKGKKLDEHINSTYRRLGDRIQISMMAIPKIWNVSKAAYESGATAEEADANMEKAMKAAIQKAKV
tara:strand:- start:133 stop:420 length:288 start_codon:yes stop_codon:yes gene_type:complete